MTDSIQVKFAPGGAMQRIYASFTPDVTTSITLKNNVSIGGIQTTRFDALTDVVADTPSTPAGSVPVYDPATDKYVVELLDLDGGTF